MSIKIFKFPTGEIQAQLVADGNPVAPVYIPMTDNLNDWFMAHLMGADAFWRSYGMQVDVVLPYLPYSRQDRAANAGDSFSLAVIGNILNNHPAISRVITFDAHSDVAGAAIQRLVNIPIEALFHDYGYPNVKFPINTHDKVLVIPDQGAFKKLMKIADKFTDVAIAIKTRDTQTGRLEVKQVIGDVYGKDCLIVDDICDGGGTFVLLAQRLYAQGAKNIDLFTTHGIYTKGLDPLLKAGITNIMCTDSFPNLAIEDSFRGRHMIECRKVLTAMGLVQS